MRVSAELLEDVRGRRSSAALLALHGAGSDAWTRGEQGRLVGTPMARPGRVLATLDVWAPDEVEPARFSVLLAELRDDLARPGGAQVDRSDVVSRLGLLDARVEAEREQVVSDLLAAAGARFERRRRWLPLQVHTLRLGAFRGVGDLVLDLPEARPTVLVGANGSGKTSLLHAAAVLLARVEAGVRGGPRRALDLVDDDITIGVGSTYISMTATVGKAKVLWSATRDTGQAEPSSEGSVGSPSLEDATAAIRADADRGDVCLPIIVHYPVNRAVLDIPLRIRTPHRFEPLEAYDGALAEGGGNFRLFFEWFREREDLENETRINDSEYRDHQLEAVRRAVHALVPEFSKLRVQRAPLRMLVNKGEQTLYVDQLSDGEKCLLAMTGDLARRLAMANPYADDPLLGGGVVLIDEIELHLHPGWQRRVVPAFERTFPNCQLILSTHSSAVLGHVDHEFIFVLQPEAQGIRVVRPDASKGMDVSRIVEDILGGTARPAEFQERIDRLFALIDAGDTAAARALHTELARTPLPMDPALVRADVLLRRREAARP